MADEGSSTGTGGDHTKPEETKNPSTPVSTAVDQQDAATPSNTETPSDLFNRLGQTVRDLGQIISKGSTVVPSEAIILARDAVKSLGDAAKVDPSAGIDPASVEKLSAQLEEMQRASGDLDFAQYARFEMQLLNVVPTPILQRTAWDIRGRYQRIFGEERFRAYLDSTPPDPATADRGLLIADLQTILRQISEAYVFAQGRERAIQRLKRYIIVWSVSTCIAASLFWATLVYSASDYRMIPLLALFGLFGSTISIFRRLQTLAIANATANDPALEILSLRLGGIGVIVALISGWVFAMLIGFIFQAGFIDLGKLAPTFDNGVLIPKTHGDMAKLLVFAFIAGFAERFVPDIIDRLTQQAAGSK